MRFLSIPSPDSIYQPPFLPRIHLISLLNTPIPIPINNISQIIVFVNTFRPYILDILFMIKYLTPYIYDDILRIWITKKQNRLHCLLVVGVGINGSLATLTKNQQRVQSVKALIGINREFGSLKNSRQKGVSK